MPLVCTSLMKGRPNGFGKKVGVIVYQSMLETINIPAKDNFQIITEHDSDTLIYDPAYLDIRRTDGIIVIQITLNEGRATSLKKALFNTIADRLHRELDVRMEDVMINLVEVKKENWSFGNGIAQYA